MKNLENKTINNEYVKIIDQCLANLRLGNGSDEDKVIWSEIIFKEIINHIRLGNDNINTRLEMLNKIFDDRSLLVYKNVDENIRLAYEDILHKIDDDVSQSDIKSKVELLQSK